MKRILYVGLEVPRHLQRENVDHCPLIKVCPRTIEDPSIMKIFSQLDEYTHFIFTSKSAVTSFFSVAMQQPIKAIGAIVVGRSTATHLQTYSNMPVFIAENETAEGIIELIEKIHLSNSRILWPHSSLSRPLIGEYLQKRKIQFDECVFYDTVVRYPRKLPELEHYHEIYFTSPSTVNAFIEIFGALPLDKKLTCIGPVTEKRLQSFVTI